MAANTAEMLLMVGLPELESMRCRLLLGLSIYWARASKPTVALAKSRKISLAESGSTLMNNVIASSGIACAKAGSLCTRAATVSLKSRVSAVTNGNAYLTQAPHPYPSRLLRSAQTAAPAS